MAQLHIAQTRAFDAHARDAQHVRRLIDANPPRGQRPQEFEHPAGAGAKIEERKDRARADCPADRGFDAFFRNMHGAHLVPVRRLRREITGRLVRAGLADLDEPRAVGGKMRVGGGKARDEVAG